MFTITSRPEPSIEGAVIQLIGDVMSDADDKLQTTFAAVIAQRPRNVVLDMSGLEVISSTNISELVKFRKEIVLGSLDREGGQTKAQGRVVIAGAPVMIQKTLQFTRLDHLFPLYHDVPSAIVSLSGSAATA